MNEGTAALVLLVGVAGFVMWQRSQQANAATTQPPALPAGGSGGSSSGTQSRSDRRRQTALAASQIGIGAIQGAIQAAQDVRAARA